MPKVSRRDILASLSSSFILATNPAAATVCDVQRSRTSGISTKSYSCQLGERSQLTATFMRVNDMIADSAGASVFSDDLQDLNSMLAGTRLIENDTFATFQSLMENFSAPFSARNISVEFDGRDAQNRQDFYGAYLGSTRLRTVATWDDISYDQFPFFPLPGELRRAFMTPRGSRRFQFLRFATPLDFEMFDEKTEQYLSYWQARRGEPFDFDLFGNLQMLRYIRAGTVPNFLQLFFASSSETTCDGQPTGGAYYGPPRLLADFMVCRNDGDVPIRIDDFVGAADQTTRLRAYDPATPPEIAPLRWRPIELQPNESVIAIQRLLFGQQQGHLEYLDDPTVANRAVFGATQLPKGVVVAGEEILFDGRSHNSMIMASFNPEACCPYLMFWCDTAREWVTEGKVLTQCVGAENEGTDSWSFAGLQTRFKFIEREHERTFLKGISLVFILKDGRRIDVTKPFVPVVLDIGQSHEVAFDFPMGIPAVDVVASELTVRGYYEKYDRNHFDERRLTTCATL